MTSSLYANNAGTTLAGNISNTATVANLQSGTGALFPAISGGNWFWATLGTPPSQEIVMVTGRTGDTVTIVRAQQGTTAQSWTANSVFAQLWTAADAAAWLQSSHMQPPPVESTGAGVSITASTNITLTSSFLSPSAGYLLCQGNLNLNAAAGGNIACTLSNNYNSASDAGNGPFPQMRQISIPLPAETAVTVELLIAPGSGVSTTGDANLSTMWFPTN